MDRGGALNVTNSATGQENALPPGIAHEVLIAEPHSPQDTHTAPTDPVTEPTLNLASLADILRGSSRVPSARTGSWGRNA